MASPRTWPPFLPVSFDVVVQHLLRFNQDWFKLVRAISRKCHSYTVSLCGLLQVGEGRGEVTGVPYTLELQRHPSYPQPLAREILIIKAIIER